MTRARDVADTQDNVGGAVAPYVAGKNYLINGSMDIFQRGTSNSSFAVSNNGSYVTADRWNIGSTASVNLASSQQNADIVGTRYALRYGRVAGQTATGIVRLVNALETFNSLALAGNNVTLSFYAKRGADTPSALTCYVYWGTGTDQSASLTYTGWTGATFNSQVNTLTTTSQKFTFSTAIPSNATQVAILFDYTSTGTAGANEWVQIEKAQLEIGSVATPFSRAGGSIGGELALCQRYYQRLTATSTFGRFGFGMATGTTNCQVIFPLKTTMRTSVTALDFSGTTHFVMNDGVSNTATNTAPTLDSMQNPDNCLVVFTAASGLTAFRPYNIAGNNNATAYIGFSAEL